MSNDDLDQLLKLLEDVRNPTGIGPPSNQTLGATTQQFGGNSAGFGGESTGFGGSSTGFGTGFGGGFGFETQSYPNYGYDAPYEGGTFDYDALPNSFDDNISGFPLTDSSISEAYPSSAPSFKFEDSYREQALPALPPTAQLPVPVKEDTTKQVIKANKATTPESAYEFADDEGWLGAAIAQVSKVEGGEDVWTMLTPAQAGKEDKGDAAGSQPKLAPPRPSVSPYFMKNNKHDRSRINTPTAPAQLRSPIVLQPARPSSTSAVSFPKLPRNSPVNHTANRAPVSHPVTRTPVNATPVNRTPVNGVNGDARRPLSFVQPSLDNDNLVSVNALDTPEERRLFPYTHFNAMQSAIYDAAYNGDENLVVAAPTGSGKTTVFELTLLRMLKDKWGSQEPLAVYMAPTKALVNERLRDWASRLSLLPDFSCIEVTGDSNRDNTVSLYRSFNKVDLIVTTPEKLDSLTRKGQDFLHRLRLVMIDEVHILHEDRGPTLEVVVSRLKNNSKVRFVAVSASVPNMEDVARWIGSTATKAPEEGYATVEEMPKAKVFKFGEEFRPVPLKIEFHGVQAHNDFALGSRLDKDVFGFLSTFSEGKPSLIFCPTRRACQSTAVVVTKNYEEGYNSRRKLPWDPARNQELDITDPKIRAFTKWGVAVHHAGLELKDRRKIEDAFKNGQLHCLISTSTLAVGVNLPARLVIIKGTSMWQGSEFRDYSDVEIQQMTGRAGRPQYDKSGTVVIMCKSEKKARYENMLYCRTYLESCLHQQLTEHINSEIALGTITSLESGKKWIRNSFLWIRIQQNPRRYMSALVKDHAKSWVETLDAYVENAITSLKESALVEAYDPNHEESGVQRDVHDSDLPQLESLRPTNMGKIMSENVISYKTMCHILRMDPKASVHDLLSLLSGAFEFNGLRIRQGEAPVLNKLRRHAEIRFKVEENVKSYADKVFLHLQASFANIDFDKVSNKSENNSQLQTQLQIFQAAPRIAKVILGVALEKNYGEATCSALDLLHVINGKAWEDSATIFRQIRDIGPKSIAVLSSNNITSVDQFLKLDTTRLEHWLNRKPPFGHDTIEAVKNLPQFTLDFKENGCGTDDEGYPLLELQVTLSWKGKMFQEVKHKMGDYRSKNGMPYTLRIVFIAPQTNRLLDNRKIGTGKLKPFNSRRKATEDPYMEFELHASLRDPSETIIGIVGVDERAGLCRSFEYHPNVDPSLFPKPEPQPKADVPKPAATNNVLPSISRSKTSKTSDALPCISGSKTDKRQKKEALFLDHESVCSLESEEELIDLTTTSKPITFPSSPSYPTSNRASPIDLTLDLSPKPSSHKKRRVCAFIDDEAEESNDGDSLASLEQYFAVDSPSPQPKKRKTQEKGKGKERAKVGSWVRSTISPSSITAPEKDKGKEKARVLSWGRNTISPPIAGPSKPNPALPLTPTGGVRSHPNGTLRTFFGRTPSIDKSVNATLFQSALPDLPDLNSSSSTGSSIIKSPISEPTRLTGVDKLDEPPSGQPDDYDAWMTDLLNGM